ncbi:MAG: TIGR02099 family protein [Gammaproteobacteria bacterium]|nr:TIGR02099 family protein [Gammaproteobacteria bacterium]
MIRLLYSRLWLFGAGLVILLAALLSVARLLAPYAADYHADIERKVGELIGQRIEIGAVSIDWRRFGPRLRMNDIRLRDAESGRELVRFVRGDIEVDLLVSLLRGGWYIDQLTVSGASLVVVRAEDGGLSIAGIDVPAPAEELSEDDVDPLLAWVLSQGRLAVDDVELDWIDRHGPRPAEFHFSAVSLEMDNAGARHQFTGSALLPDLVGQRFSFAIDARGEPARPQDWNALFYVDGIGLRLAGLLQEMTVAGLALRDGSASARLWGEWRHGRMARLEGIASAAGLRLAGARVDATPVLDIDAVSGRFAWRRKGDGWRVDANDLTLARAGRVWPASSFGLQYQEPRDDAPGGVRLHAGYVDLGDAADVLLLSDVLAPRQAEILEQLAPRGRLRDVDLLFDASMVAPTLVRADFEELSTSPWERAPGMTGMDGRFVADAYGGRIDLDAVAADVRFPRLFRAPLPVDVLRGELRWTRDAGGWRVSAPRLELRNEDLVMHLWGGFDAPAGGLAPTLAVFGDFQAESVEHTSRYLPVGVMPEGTVRWLDRSILGGSVPRGTLMFFGSPGSFPFDRDDGRFRIDFDVRKGVLDYAVDWPPLDQVEANVVFDGRRMEIHAADGRSLASMVTQAEIIIADMRGRPAVLDIDGRVKGPTQDVLRYLRESPLRKRFGAYVADLHAGGDSRLGLKLAIPLNDVSATRVDGRLYLDGSQLRTSGGAFDMERIRGELGFSEAGLDARGIEADIIGLPARIDVLTESGAGGPRTRVTAAGRADTAVLERWSRLPMLSRIRSGALPWEAELHIPGAETEEIRPELSIAVDLTEAELDFPPPLRKPAGEPLRMRIDAVVPHASERPVRMRMGDRLTGLFELDDELQLRRGELRVGAGAAELPDSSGLRIAGRFEHLAYAEWAELFSAVPATEGAPGAMATPAVTGFDLFADEAEFFGRAYHQAHIVGRRETPGWALRVASAELQGDIAIPADSRTPWTMDLDRLYLKAPPEPAGTGEDSAPTRGPDPRELPAVRLQSQDFRYNDIAFGNLDLAASRQEAGLRLDRLLLSSRHMRIDAKGDWVVSVDGQSSAFSIKLDSDDFGAALTDLGYAGTIDEGKAHLDINASWDGPPTDFALEHLDGSMGMKVENGRLLDVEPGAGRIFGLLSLQYLPRRLSLDFSDFFRKGFSFDSILGNFAIKDGRASTHDLLMDGPAARIAVDGGIDLAARTYDQTVVVTPSVTSGLPVAGAVAGGMGVGAVILLMEKMLRPIIERLTRITYRVTGGWSDPVIERLQDAERSDNR